MVAEPGPLWASMNARPRASASTLQRAAIPNKPGVYAWYRDGEPVYVGRAIGQDGLRRRLWTDHLGTTADISRSSFRRAVSVVVGVAPNRKKVRPSPYTAEGVQPIREWIVGCEVAWLACAS